MNDMRAFFQNIAIAMNQESREDLHSPTALPDDALFDCDDALWH